MTEQRAKRILGKAITKTGLHWHGADDRIISWSNNESTVWLEGRFTALELEAIAWWVGHKQKRG